MSVGIFCPFYFFIFSRYLTITWLTMYSYQTRHGILYIRISNKFSRMWEWNSFADRIWPADCLLKTHILCLAYYPFSLVRLLLFPFGFPSIWRSWYRICFSNINRCRSISVVSVIYSSKRKIRLLDKLFINGSHDSKRAAQCQVSNWSFEKRSSLCYFRILKHQTNKTKHN